MGCYDGDVYQYGGSGERGERVDTCGQFTCSNRQCSTSECVSDATRSTSCANNGDLRVDCRSGGSHSSRDSSCTNGKTCVDGECTTASLIVSDPVEDTTGSTSCDQCGDGIVNFCSESECLGLGNCRFTSGTLLPPSFSSCEDVLVDISDIPINYQAERRCFDNDVYWYDSTGAKGVKDKECGSQSTGGYRDVCYKAECGACRYDFGLACATDRDGYKQDSNCVDRPRYIWMEQSGGGVYGSGGTWGYHANLHAVTAPRFQIGTNEYISDGYMIWRGASRGSGWYEVCETKDLVS